MTINIEKQDEFDFDLVSNADLNWRVTRSKPSFRKSNGQCRAMFQQPGEGKCGCVRVVAPAQKQGDRYKVLQCWNLKDRIIDCCGEGKRER